jgi:hypothetical protein
VSDYAAFDSLHYRATVAVFFPSVAPATATGSPAELRKPGAKANYQPF